MNAEQFKQFMAHQKKAQAELIASLQKMVVKQTKPATESSTVRTLPFSPPLEVVRDSGGQN